MMFALIFIPAHLWNHPSNEAVYHGFDPNLLYMNARGDGSASGLIDASPGSLTMTALPGSDPTVDLVTSALSFAVSVDVDVRQSAPGAQLSIGIWSPTLGSGYYLEFGPPPANELRATSFSGGHGSVTLQGAILRSITNLGTYIAGQVYRVSLVLDRATNTITATAVALNPSPAEQPVLAMRSTTDAKSLPELFRAFRPTLATSLSATSGTVSAELNNFSIVLPSQPTSAGELVETIDDIRAKTLTVILTILGVLAIVTAVAMWIRRIVRIRSRRDGNRTARQRFQRKHVILVVGGVAVYCGFNAWLFHLGTPHFDVFSAKIWSYIAANYNFADLYHRPLIVPAAGVEGGVPNHEASFPYGPTKTYYYLAIGWIYRLIFAHANSGIDTFQFEALLKSFNVVFALCDAFLVYFILTRVGIKVSDVRIAVGLFVVNPALMFIASIWGSTETISIFFILLSVWFALKVMPPWAWIMLVLGAFTRPQMLVLAFLLGCVYLRIFSLGRNLRGISWAIITFFVVVAPLSIAISPSFPLDYIVHVLSFQVGTGQADNYSAVSPGYYSIWTLPLLYIQNQHGINRMWYPRTADLVGPISYTAAGALVVVVFLLTVGAVLLIRRRRWTANEYLPVVAFGMLGWLMLSTSLISRYFLYGLVLLVLCRGAMKGLPYYLSVLWLTAVTLVTSWSHFGLDILGSNATANPLNPLNSSLTRAIQELFFNDRFITEATVLNIVVLTYIGLVAFRASPRSQGADEPNELMHIPAT